MERVSEISSGYEAPLEPFTDSPEPGRGYVRVLLVFFLATISPLGYFSWQVYRQKPENALILIPTFIIVVPVFFLLLHAAFRTRYSLDSEKLVMKSGIFGGTVRLSQINEISRSPFNWRVLGWGIGKRGFCNRFTDGVKLRTGKESVYISPTNPRLFMSQIRSMRFSTVDPEKTKS